MEKTKMTIRDGMTIHDGVAVYCFKVGQSAPSLEDFTCELLDMVRPMDLNRFTLNDLINCRMGK